MPLIILAPMEGLLDHRLRDVLTRVGGIDRCVSAFIRITDMLLPDRVFTRIVPELLTGSRTAAGVPVRAQLLGSDPTCMAENAAKLATLGPEGLDLNFGCPAKCVNRHRGGAVLLDEPELIARIVAAVRRAVPAHLPLSAKMRLGYLDDSRTLECAQAMADSGAEELVIHARTKVDGYKPPAYWDRIAAVRAALTVRVVANGEIWTPADAAQCTSQSGCADLMLGRGIVADPGLALAIRSQGAAPLAWEQLLPLIQVFWDQVRREVAPRDQAGRLKQWLNHLRRRHPEAEAAYQRVRTIDSPEQLQRGLFGWGCLQEAA